MVVTLNPIFVVDRPASLRILSALRDHTNKFGILSHAFTTNNFKVKFREFDIASIKVGDSGIYQGKDISYECLFSEYEKMGVTHGIIKDCYKDPKQTLNSAIQAIRIYKKGKRKGLYTFELLGVAQGNTVADYIESYNAQKKLGFKMVAIGGLLYKIENHKRMVKVRSNVFLRNVLTSIRRFYPTDDLFPLGVFNRNRLKLFYDLNIWGADYKGWIFKYNMEESHMLNNRFEQVRDYLRTNIFNEIDNHYIDESTHMVVNEAPIKRNKKRNRLLILSCSKTKSLDPGRAIDVYKGQAYSQVKKYYSKNNHLDVKIISAKYGLIDRKDIIDPYDNKMDHKSSKIYKKAFKDDLEVLSTKYDDILVFGGKLYKDVVPENGRFQYTDGKIGQQLQQLKKWLNSE
ncbi:MAG: DUF6884 domain-containing protein [Thermoplasmataceae archaeon]